MQDAAPFIQQIKFYTGLFEGGSAPRVIETD